MKEGILIDRVESLTKNYTFDRPFSRYLNEFFKTHPEMGSRDRRMTREWSYNLFRIGRNLEQYAFIERLSVACFLCNTSMDTFLDFLLRKNLKLNAGDIILPPSEKVRIIKEKYSEFDMQLIFPMNKLLSNQITKDAWYNSFLVKPRVWIRIKEKFRASVLAELSERKIEYEESGNSISFLPATALEKTVSFEKGYFEIQDFSSQRTAGFFKPKPHEVWWDACSGSGGKSLLLFEMEPSVKILATDSREQILKNYRLRLKKSGISKFQSELFDFTNDQAKLPFSRRDISGIIADVPCSGSGTWARSPENNLLDLQSRLNDFFIPLQQKIVTRLAGILGKGCPLIYITCSVFEAENEENVRLFLQNLPLELEKSAYLEGYETKGDTLFIARFIRK